jgi:hypothetical protein
MFQLQDKTIEGETLELGNEVVNYLGPNLTIKRSTVVFKTAAKGLVLNKVRFVDCHLDFKKKLSNFSFEPAFLKGCRVTGTLRGAASASGPKPMVPTAASRTATSRRRRSMRVSSSAATSSASSYLPGRTTRCSSPSATARSLRRSRGPAPRG